MGILNVVSLVSLILFVLYTRYLISLPENKRENFLKIQLTIVLLYNIAIHIIQWGKVPVEFSTISYFIIPIVIYFKLEKIELYAVYAALMSGVFYYLSMIAYGNGLYGDFPLYSWTTSLFNHGTLLAYGATIMYTRDFKEIHRFVVWMGLVFNIVWALSLRPIVNHSGRVFIYEILDANLVRFTFDSPNILMYIVYYILLGGFLYGTSQGLLKLNQFVRKKGV